MGDIGINSTKRSSLASEYKTFYLIKTSEKSFLLLTAKNKTIPSSQHRDATVWTSLESHLAQKFLQKISNK